MKAIYLSLLLAAGLNAYGQKVVDLVDPMIGTVRMGHTFPGACVPHGMVQLSPDTDTIPHDVDGKYQKDVYAYCAGYQYSDSSIVGFSHTHLSGTGHSDLGDILIMPFTGKPVLNPGTAAHPETGYRSPFSHATEKASPGYYEVRLDKFGILAQLTATERVGVHRYTYPAGEKPEILLDLIHGIYNYDGKTLWASLRVENDSLVTGYRITDGWARENYTYFAIAFSSPIRHYGYVEKERPKYNGFWGKFPKTDFPEMAGRKIVAWFDFGQEAPRVLELRVALSAVSTAGAVRNLRAEALGKSFEQIHAEAVQKWEKDLSRIEAQGPKDKLTQLYTSLYHTLIHPTLYMDVDGQYRGIDHNIHKAEGFTNYTVFSVWDTYRALHPLFNLIDRSRSRDFVESMLAHYDQSVHKMLPVWSLMGNEGWCMIGYHAVSVLADALTKGIAINRQRALDAMVHTSNVPYYGDIRDYLRYGYVPVDRSGEGASQTLEYAYDDWAIYHTALLCGNDSLAARYAKRAMNYRNEFDPASQFVGARLADGGWKKPFSRLSTQGQGFTEGNAWNYTFYAPQDVRGLIREMGGDAKFVRRLDSLFTMHLPDAFFAETEDVTRDGILGGYVQGNEPSHHIPYLYMYTSQPWKTQYWLREIMDRMYRDGIGGLCGNDDCGQMSAWYIFTAMGFYPVCPGSDQFVIGAPYFPLLKVYLENGKTITIRADKVSDKMRYVKSLRLNGKPYNKAYLTYNDLRNGAELDFEMSAKPNKHRLFTGADAPYSMSR
ncbi:MAG: GH92 family glycosyl hydrolase [Tannerella sp.]|jgi:predicted alpha-1,2-mannosidase|nr:GH92 family glycosyl hydrolase [Tannerella sp.]